MVKNAKKTQKARKASRASRRRAEARRSSVQNTPQHEEVTDRRNAEQDWSGKEGSGDERDDNSRPTSDAPSQGHNEIWEVDTEEDEDSSEVRNTRGPNRGMDVPENIEDRPAIFTIGGRFPDTSVTSDIVVTIKGNFEGPWATWRSVPQSIKDLYWDKFKKHFKWPSTRESQIHKAWKNTCSDRFRDILCLARKHAKRISGSKQAKNWIDLNPQWMNSSIWNQLIREVWSQDKWQKQSDAGTNNRLNGNEKASPTYTGGSIPISAHKYRMKKELNRNPTELELFDRTHKTDGEYVSAKAKRVRERYDSILEDKYPDTDSRPDFDPTTWIEASEGLSKKKVYGFGPTQRGIGVIGDGCDKWTYGEGSSDQAAFENIMKLNTDECTKEVVEHVKTVLPNMVCELLQQLKRHGSRIVHEDDLEDDENSESYASYDSYEDENSESYENVEKSRRNRVYPKQTSKKCASGGSGKKRRDNDDPTSGKKKKTHKRM